MSVFVVPEGLKVPALPTAKQVPPAQATPLSLTLGAGLGLGTCDQPVPVHRSTSVLSADELRASPTAMQLVVMHVTPPNAGNPDSFGVATFDQCEPFHRTATAFLLSAVEFTARHALIVMHDTPASCTPKEKVGEVGWDRADQPDPFHRSSIG